MTRREILHLLIGQARQQGFEFRRWFIENTALEWTTYGDALDWLSLGKRAHMLLFSHGFARHFFQSGDKLTYLVPPQTFERVSASGGSLTVKRKAHLRRSSRQDVWTFHVREMAATAEPLRYIRRFLITEETLREVAGTTPKRAAADDDNYDDENLVRDGA